MEADAQGGGAFTLKCSRCEGPPSFCGCTSVVLNLKHGIISTDWRRGIVVLLCERERVTPRSVRSKESYPPIKVLERILFDMAPSKADTSPAPCAVRIHTQEVHRRPQSSVPSPHGMSA